MRHPGDLVAVSIFANVLIAGGAFLVAADFGWVNAQPLLNATGSYLVLPSWMTGVASLPFLLCGIGLLLAVWMEMVSRADRVSIPSRPSYSRHRPMVEMVFTVSVSVFVVFIGGLIAAAGLGLIKFTASVAPFSPLMSFVGVVLTLCALLIGTSAALRWWKSAD